MTVAELIEGLRDQPQDAKVMLNTNVYDGVGELYEIRIEVMDDGRKLVCLDG